MIGKNYAFIDSQNLNLAIQQFGQKLDFKKFRIFLRDKYKVEKAFLFMGYVTGNEMMYASLQSAGYVLIFKPTLDKNGVIKGNCDAELVLRCMIEYDNFDKAVIVSGDGDFHCLVKYLAEQNKLLKIGIPNKKQYSSLLRKYTKYFFYVSDHLGKLHYRKQQQKKHLKIVKIKKQAKTKTKKR
ncbi:NYN domain-containing protein [Patescibacteria group bacterium]|nr:NYN domain-containing protein [Patescibacteria group bacterium]MBU1016110.1 NYN domain-containing protein [Patescibacteria group bacterium]MBU1684853.1 NYN domain-containing protein [Patescibacteria group bacterium]MBU1938569.1 NYN domain-containing protein [Patescibacteria group bacterium]